MKSKTLSEKKHTHKPASSLKNSTATKKRKAPLDLVDSNALIESEQRFRILADTGHVLIRTSGIDKKCDYVNQPWLKFTGRSLKEELGEGWTEDVHPDDLERCVRTYSESFDRREPFSISYRLRCSTGKYRWIQDDGTPRFDSRGNFLGYIGHCVDITEFKHTEEALRKSEERYRTILERIEDGYYEADLAGNFTFFNDSICRIWGYPKEELMGMNNRQYTDKETAAKLYAAHNKVYRTEEPGRLFDYEIIRKDGTRKIVQSSFSLMKDEAGKPIGFMGTIRDVTERNRMEEDIVKSEQNYRTIIENSQEGIFQTSPTNHHLTLNSAFATMLGYASREDAAKSITSIANQIYVNPEEYLTVLDIVRREGSIKNYETEFYRRDKSRIWVNMSISSVRDNHGELLYYHGIVNDITFKKKLEEERQDSIDRLRRSLGATINAMSATVEAKDPYTAGHQRRVADLARSIATEMKLSRDQIDGIRLAGMIHDLGKISVPSEILTKPTRLTELEFELIKTHSEAGYNILKDIEFPWPIARIVLEHHERINGSGYPNGLKGEDILLESKIIAIADVVEAISSHRPYRPAFGIGKALDEIAKNSGILFDTVIAEACLKLFRENRYTMPY